MRKHLLRSHKQVNRQNDDNEHKKRWKKMQQSLPQICVNSCNCLHAILCVFWCFYCSVIVYGFMFCVWPFWHLSLEICALWFKQNKKNIKTKTKTKWLLHQIQAIFLFQSEWLIVFDDVRLVVDSVFLRFQFLFMNFGWFVFWSASTFHRIKQPKIHTNLRKHFELNLDLLWKSLCGMIKNRFGDSKRAHTHASNIKCANKMFVQNVRSAAHSERKQPVDLIVPLNWDMRRA